MERQLGRARSSAPTRLRRSTTRDGGPRDAATPGDGTTGGPFRRPEHRVTLTGDGGDETLGGMWRSAPAVLADAFLTRRSNRTGVPGCWRAPCGRTSGRSCPACPRHRSVPIGALGRPRPHRRDVAGGRFVDAEPKWTRTTLRRHRDPLVARRLGRPAERPDTELDRGRYVELRQPLHDVRVVRLALRLPARVMGSPQTEARHLHGYAFGSSLPALVTGRTWGTEFSSLRVRELQRLVEGLGGPAWAQRGRLDRCPCSQTARESAMPVVGLIGPLACCTLWSYGYRTRHHRSNETALHRSSGERRGLVARPHVRRRYIASIGFGQQQHEPDGPVVGQCVHIAGA